jgi:hypothetical protein
MNRHRSVIFSGALLAVVAAFPLATSAAAKPLLPDLWQETPYSLQVAAADSGSDRAYHLGFASTVYNFGRGPLVIDGQRASTAEAEMTASQVVEDSNGTSTRYPDVGRLRFVESATHRHWHYLGFDSYKLRRVDGSLAKSDQKTGFCLGDRVLANDSQTLPGQPPAPVFTGGCAYDDPGVLTVREGISVNYADPYDAHREGQFVDLTGLPAGRYQLVHTVNANGALHESERSNNAASVLIGLSWPDGTAERPRVVELMRCALSARCPAPPQLTARTAAPLARAAFRHAYAARSPRVTCRAPSRGNKSRCVGNWRGGSGSTTVGYAVSRGFLYASYTASARGRRPAHGRVRLPFGRGRTVPFTAAPPA